MPFGLGFFAVAGAGVAAAGSYDLLQTEILTGSQASVTFSNLNSTYGADYQHLQIRSVTRATDDSATIFAQFNLDTAGNYSAHRLFGQGSSVVSDAFTSQSYLFAGANMNTSGAANGFAASVVEILDPFSTNKFTTTRTLAGVAGGANYVVLQSGSWRNTAALTEIKLYPNLGNFAQYSRFSLYGLRK